MTQITDKPTLSDYLASMTENTKLHDVVTSTGIPSNQAVKLISGLGFDLRKETIVDAKSRKKTLTFVLPKSAVDMDRVWTGYGLDRDTSRIDSTDISTNSNKTPQHFMPSESNADVVELVSSIINEKIALDYATDHFVGKSEGKKGDNRSVTIGMIEAFNNMYISTKLKLETVAPHLDTDVIVAQSLKKAHKAVISI